MCIYEKAVVFYICIKQLKTLIPLDPAMKPRMRAFSGLVTLLAVLNISWAAYIWSLWRSETVGTDNLADVLISSDFESPEMVFIYRKWEVLFGLWLWWRRGCCRGGGLRCAGRLSGGLWLAGCCSCWWSIAGGGGYRCAGGCGSCRVCCGSRVVHRRPLLVLAR